MQNKVTQEQIDRIIAAGKVEISDMGENTTVVRFTSKEGFEIVETSACVDKANYNRDLGAENCIRKIKDKLLAYEGYCLQKNLFSEIPLTAKERVEKELYELQEKYDKLSVFLLSKRFDSMRDAEKDYLIRQQKAMWDYIAILHCRLSIWED